jgi:Grx4 family monothiol glutaredoxin
MMIPSNGIILFSASWASESSQSARQILETACPLHSISYIEIEEKEETEGLFDGMGIEVVPCVVRMWEGKEIGRVNGVESKEILSLLKKSTRATVTHNNIESSISGLGENIQEQKATSPSPEMLKELVGRSKLMLFIKGTPSRPQCGFTTQLIRLLSENELHPDVHYHTFNILEDQGVREALKVWSQWPTYPQIYWNGELLGGLDILKEMFSTGQMSEILSLKDE